MRGEARIIKPAAIEKFSYLLGTGVESLLKNPDRLKKPLPGIAKAGCGLLTEEDLAGYGEVSKSDCYRGDCLLRVCGDSTTGAHIHDQDLIYVRRYNDVESGTTAVILIGNTEVTIKCIIKKESSLILEAINPTVPARYFMQEEVRDLPVETTGKVFCSRSDIA